MSSKKMHPSRPVGNAKSFEDAFSAGLRNVIIYRAIGAARLPAADSYRPWVRSTVCAIGWVVALPLIVLFASPFIPWWAPPDSSLLAVLLMCVLNLVTLSWGAFSWALLVRRTAWVDGMVDEELRAQLVRKVDGATSRPFAGWLLVALIVFVVIEAPGMMRQGELVVPSLPVLFSAIEISVVVGTTLKLSWDFPSIFTVIHRARDRRGSLRLIRLAPSATPGLRFFSDGLAFGSSFLLACLVIAVAIGLLIRFAGQSTSGIAAGLPALIGVILLLLLRFAVLPVTQLHWVLLGAKLRVLTELEDDLRYSRAWRSSKRNAAALATEQMGVLLATDNLPFKSAIVLQFVGIGGGAVAAYVAQLFLTAP